MGRVAAVVLVLLTTACAGATDATVVRESPSQIELRWYNDSTGLGSDQAAQVAAGHCARYGKRSSFGSVFMDRDVSLETFQCTAAPPA